MGYHWSLFLYIYNIIYNIYNIYNNIYIELFLSLLQIVERSRMDSTFRLSSFRAPPLRINSYFSTTEKYGAPRTHPAQRVVWQHDLHPFDQSTAQARRFSQWMKPSTRSKPCWVCEAGALPKVVPCHTTGIGGSWNVLFRCLVCTLGAWNWWGIASGAHPPPPPHHHHPHPHHAFISMLTCILSSLCV